MPEADVKASGRRTGGIDKNADSAGHQEAHQQHEVRERPMVAGWYADLSTLEGCDRPDIPMTATSLSCPWADVVVDGRDVTDMHESRTFAEPVGRMFTLKDPVTRAEGRTSSKHDEPIPVPGEFPALANARDRQLGGLNACRLPRTRTSRASSA